MSETWRLAIRNLARNKRRNVATGAAIAVGFAALLALGGYAHRVKNFLEVHAVYVKQTGHITIYAPGGLDHFATKPQAYSLGKEAQGLIATELSALSNVDFFGAQLLGSGLVGNGCKSLPFYATGIDPTIDRRIRSHPAVHEWTPQFTSYSKGRGLWEYPDDFGAIALSEGLARLLRKPHVVADFNAETAPLVLADCQSPNLAEQLAADANVQLMGGNWTGGMAALDGEVVAHYSTGVNDTNSTSLLTSLHHLQKLYDTPNVTFFSVWLKDPSALAQTFATLSTNLESKGLAVDLYRWDDERISPLFKGTMDFLYTMLGFIACVLGTIIIFSIFNATTITIIERGQEIGMMRSLGYTRAQIHVLYLREVVVLTLLALAIGSLIGGSGMLALNSANVRFHPPGVAGGMQLMLIPSLPFSLGAACLICLLAIAATYLAIYKSTARPIPDLLGGGER